LDVILSNELEEFANELTEFAEESLALSGCERFLTSFGMTLYRIGCIRP